MTELNEELKKALEGGDDDTTKDTKGESQTIINNDKKDATADDTLRAQVADLEFKSNFATIKEAYPYAVDFQTEIREKVNAGYSIDDATLAVLAKNDKLKTAAQIRAEENKGQGFGGSAATNKLDDTSAEPKTAEEWAKRFQELEAKGEIIIT